MSGSGSLSGSLKNASYLSMSLAITMPLGIISKILVPRFVGAEQAGILFFCENFPLMFLPIMTLGFSAYLSKNIAVNPDHANEVAGSLFAYSISAGVFLTLAILGYFSLTTQDDVTIAVAGFATLTSVINSLYVNIFRPIYLAINRVKYIAVINIIDRLLSSLIILPFLFAGMGIVWVAIAGLIAQVVVLLIVVSNAVRSGLLRFKFKAGVVAHVIRTSIHYSLNTMISGLNVSIDAAALKYLSSYAEVGYYAASQRIFQAALLLIPVFSQAFGPNMTRLFTESPDKYRSTFQAANRFFVMAASLMGLGYSAFAADVMALAFGEEFGPSVKLVPFQAAMIFVTYLVLVIATHTFSTTTGKPLTIGIICGGVVNVVLDLLLIPIGGNYLGAGGAGVASVIATTIAQSVEGLLFLQLTSTKVVGRREARQIGLGLLPLLLLILLHDQWMRTPLLVRIPLFLIATPSYLLATKLLFVKDIKDGYLRISGRFR